jgi:hypothetical protein
VVGSRNSATNGAASGSVRIFDYAPGTGWIEGLGDTIHGDANAEAGTCLALSSDGRRVVVGSPKTTHLSSVNVVGKVSVHDLWASTAAPTTSPAPSMSFKPSNTPSVSLAPSVSLQPSTLPTNAPTSSPTAVPTTAKPTTFPTLAPTPFPTTPIPTVSPTGVPTPRPCKLKGKKCKRDRDCCSTSVPVGFVVKCQSQENQRRCAHCIVKQDACTRDKECCTGNCQRKKCGNPNQPRQGMKNMKKNSGGPGGNKPKR